MRVPRASVCPPVQSHACVRRTASAMPRCNASRTPLGSSLGLGASAARFEVVSTIEMSASGRPAPPAEDSNQVNSGEAATPV